MCLFVCACVCRFVCSMSDFMMFKHACAQPVQLLHAALQAKTLVSDVVQGKLNCLNPTRKALQLALASTDKYFLHKVSRCTDVKQDFDFFRPSAVVLAKFCKNHNQSLKPNNAAWRKEDNSDHERADIKPEVAKTGHQLIDKPSRDHLEEHGAAHAEPSLSRKDNQLCTNKSKQGQAVCFISQSFLYAKLNYVFGVVAFWMQSSESHATTSSYERGPV